MAEDFSCGGCVVKNKVDSKDGAKLTAVPLRKGIPRVEAL